MRFTKKQLYRITAKFHKILLENPELFELKKLKNGDGRMDWDSDDEKDRIRIDYRGEFLPTCIHECIHYLYPYMNHTRVRQLEKNLLNQLSMKQVKMLLKMFVNILC